MSDLNVLGQNAVNQKIALANLSTEEKNKALLSVAEYLERDADDIIRANAIDMQNADAKGMSSGLKDRLKLTTERIKSMAEGLRQIADLPDCIGEIMESFDRPNGLHIQKVRVPIGVIGIIYEARPNVTADAFGLCFKTGNAVILKGGSDAIHSNKAIVKSIRNSLQMSRLSPDCIQLIEDTDRAVTLEFMKLKEYVDILIPRGSAGLIRSVVENSIIPVIETGTGNCHIYVDESADIEMALDIIYNAKTQRVGVCNACESLLVHEKVINTFLPKLKARLDQKNVELRGDLKVLDILSDCTPATEEDYATEYLDYILSIKTVSSVEEAIDHINQYGTKHSECIVTENESSASKFMNNIDAACVYHNASTRFTDGFEFGFGAEIGISTQKLHARGPMGLKEITTYKYKISGNGQIRK